jgi:predicted dehydrogenase
VGRVRLVYANFDDGMIAPNLSPWDWTNESGVAWPAKDEFEVGCTYEHAGYLLTWLAAYFGPAKAVTSFASVQIPEKGVEVEEMAPDFMVGCIEYGAGVVARVTCSLVAPLDKSLTIIGDRGVITTPNVRNDLSPVFLKELPMRGNGRFRRRAARMASWFEGHSANGGALGKQLDFVRQKRGRLVSAMKPVDFCRGPAEMAAAIKEQRPCRLSAELGLHVTEMIEALQYPERFGGRKLISSTFAPIAPM